MVRVIVVQDSALGGREARLRMPVKWPLFLPLKAVSDILWRLI